MHVLFLFVTKHHNSLPKCLDLSSNQLEIYEEEEEDESSKQKTKMCTTHHNDQSQHNLPCLHCDPHSYIRMVQHMIERCIILRMSRDDCVKALDHHASILPLVTLTIWRGLERENKDFFETYDGMSTPSLLTPEPLPSGYVRRSPRLARRIQQ